MPLIDSVWYDLELKDKGFADSLKKASAGLDGLDQGAKKAGAGVDGAFKAMHTAGETWTQFLKTNMGPAMAQLGGHVPAIKELGVQWKALKSPLDGLDTGAKTAAAGVGHLQNGITSLTSELKRLAAGFGIAWAAKAFIQNTVEAQRALAQLGAALRSTGGAAGFTLPELVKMSEEMSKLSTFSNEAVQGGLSRLLTYTGLQGPMFKEAARATLDFATALGIDTTSAAERVGNALQYPTEAINSLTKQGFRFTSEQKRLIAAFEDTGQLAKAQAIILGELDLAYKGSAEAARDTLGGALTGLKNDFMSTLEVSKESSGGIIEAVNSIAESMPVLRTAFNAFFRELNLMFSDSAITWQKFLNLFRNPDDRITAEEFKNLRIESTGLGAMLDQASRPTPPKGKKPSPPPLRGLTDAQLAAQAAARSGFEAALAGQTTGGADNFEAQVTKLVAAAQKAHLGATEIQKMVAELRDAHAKTMAEEGQKLALTFQQQLAQLTATTVDDLRAQLAEFDRAIEEQRAKGVLIDPTVVNQLRAAKEQAIELAPKTEEIAAALERINAATAQGFNLSGSLDEMNTLIDKATAIRDATPVGSAARVAAQERLNALIAKEAEIRKKLRDIMLLTANESTKLAANIESVSGGIANAANAAFGLASAFLGVNSNITKALGSIGQLAGGISSVSGLATQAGGFGKLFSSGAGIASALPGIGQAIGGAMALASTLFGKSPEELERQRLYKENTLALRHLTERVGDLAKINVSGAQFGQFSAFLKDPRTMSLVNDWQGYVTADNINRQIGAILDSMGLSAEQFKEFAKSFGIAVGTGPGGKITLDDIRQIQEAVASSELNQFADDFAGQMQRLDAQIKLFDLTKPIDQFEAFRKVLAGIKGGAGAVGELLKGFDLTTAAGIEAAQKAIQDLFTQFQALPADQLGAFLGGLTPQEFLDAIQRANDLLNAQSGSGAVPGTGGFNVSRTITEVTGNRLEALFSTGNIFAEQTARNTGLIAQLLGGTSLPMINAPSLATSSLGASAGPLVVIESLTVQLSGLTDPARAQEIGARVGTSVLEEINRGLGQRLQFAKLARGQLS